MQASEIRELLKLLDQPGIISFAGGIPDPALFPVEEAKAAYAAVLGDAAQAGSGAAIFGERGLSAAAPVDRRGTWRPWACRASADNVLITSGSQQALEFLGGCCFRPATLRW